VRPGIARPLHLIHGGASSYCARHSQSSPADTQASAIRLRQRRGNLLPPAGGGHPGAVGEGVEYALTAHGRQLGPALALFRHWGLDEQLPPGGDGLPHQHDLSCAVPADLALRESCQWRLDDDMYTLAIDGQELTIDWGPARQPALRLATTGDFMRRWAAGETSWDTGRSDGDVTVRGSAAAWDRMLLATGYPGRPPDPAAQLRARQLQESRRGT
jgi:hypothetical protein